MPGTLIKVKGEKGEGGNGIVRVSTYSKELGKSSSFYFYRKEFDNLPLNKPYTCADGDNYATITRTIGRSGEELIFRFMWLDFIGGNHYDGIGESVRVNYEKFWAAVEKSAEQGRSESMLALMRKRPKIEFYNHGNLKNVLQYKEMRRKLFSFLEQNFQWMNASKIVISNSFDPYDFFFEEKLYDESMTGLCGGLIYHEDKEDPRRSRYELHT